MDSDGDDRGTSDRLSRSKEALDAQMAGVVEITTVATALKIGQFVEDEVGAVLRHAEAQASRFESAPGPLTRRALAADLLEVYRILRERESTARRGSQGELLKEVKSITGAMTLAPWASSMPKRLEDLAAGDSKESIFSRHSIDRWIEALSYRPAPAAPTKRTQHAPVQFPKPSNNTDVQMYRRIPLIRRGGKGTLRELLPWPLPPLVVRDAYKIQLVKGPGMSFFTREGRIEILAYLIEVVAKFSDDGDRVLSKSEPEHEWVQPKVLATRIVEDDFDRILFKGDELSFKLFEQGAVGSSYGHLLEFNFVDKLEIYYTNIKESFKFINRGKSKDPKRGCASIEWITEWLPEVPHYHKELWVQNTIMESRKVLYPENVVPGTNVPAGMFLTKKTAQALRGKDNQVLFVGGFRGNERIIKTEDGRVWLVNERDRDLAAFCDAVVQLKGILTLSFILASIVGAAAGGLAVNFLLTANDVAMQVDEAGGIRNYIKYLRDHPGRAALLVADLAGLIGPTGSKGERALLMNPHETLEASIRKVESGASTKRALSDVGDQTVNRAAGQEPRLLDEAKSNVDGSRLAEANQGALGKAVDRPPSGRPASEGRGTTRPTDPPHPKPDAPPRAKEPPEIEVEVTDPLKKGGIPQPAKDVGAGRQRPRSNRPARRPDGTVRDVRQRRPKGGGEKVRGQPSPLSNPVRAFVRSRRAATKTQNFATKARLAKIQARLTRLTDVIVELGALAGNQFAKITGLKAIRDLFAGRLSDFHRLAKHWPHKLANEYMAEIQKLIMDRVKRTKLAQEVETAFRTNKVNSALLNKLPESLQREIKDIVERRWNTIRKAFWRNVYDDRALVAELKKIGLIFGNRGTAPVLEIGGTKLKMTLDHVARKVENPLEAFSPNNLRVLTSKDNSVLKEGLVRNIKKLTNLTLDEYNALSRASERLPKKLADELGEVLDALPNEEDLFRGLGWPP